LALGTFVLRRLGYSFAVLLVASVLVFVFVRLTTDPLARFRVSAAADPTLIERETKALGLDKPLTVQYVTWLKQFVRGDWGVSYISRREVEREILPALWNTIKLMFWAVVLSALIAIATGVYSAWRQYSKLDYALTGLAFVGISMPTAFFGLLVIQVFSFELGKRGLSLDGFPLFFSVDLTGEPFYYPRRLALPVLVLMVQLVARWSRYQRATMLDVKSADYIRTARAKGLPRWKVVLKHGLRNALIPLVTIMAIDIGQLFSGLLVTEQIFSWPGMGRLLISSVLQGDVPIVLPWLIITAAFVIVANLLADLLYGVLDPRIRVA
jgi:peptide/nickel transport system permease protein